MIDNLDLRDDTGLAGYVVITDNKTGKILLKKHNMIVKEGRDYILNSLFNGFTVKGSDGTVDMKNTVNDETSILTLNTIFFSSSIEPTRFDLKYADLTSKEEIYIGDDDVSGLNNRVVFTLMNDSDSADEKELRPGMKIDMHIKELNLFGSSLISINSIASLGLILSDGDDENANKKLYSRIVFDPILLSDDSDFTITYYTYI